MRPPTSPRPAMRLDCTASSTCRRYPPGGTQRAIRRAITGFPSACSIGQVFLLRICVRPSFAQWLTYPRVRQDIVRKGQINLPFGDARHAPIAAEDQARVIAAILANPAPHSGETYRLFGPVEMDEHGVAKAVGEALGREVIYNPIGIADFRRQLEQFSLPEQTIQP